MRLDEILLQEGLVTKTQVQEALDYQKHHGGRLESHLFRLGYVDESGLVMGLSRQFGREGICVTGLSIGEPVLALIPPEITFLKVVLPFAWDQPSRTVKVACENPQQEDLHDELASIIGGQDIHLMVALGDALRAAIVEHYRHRLSYLTNPDGLITLRDEKIAPSHESAHGSVLILDADGSDVRDCERNLQKSGFVTWVARSTDVFMDQFASGRWDIILLVHQGVSEEMQRLVANLAVQGFEPDVLPTCLLTSDLPSSEVLRFLKEGYAEVIPINDSELLTIKLDRLRSSLAWESERRFVEMKSLGTHGTLEDMNLIDLLQAMGPSYKTARINVTAEAKQLTIFLQRGRIIYAECDGITGPEAIYMAIPWTRGIWSVDPIEPENLPQPNTFESNESILLEGCRQLDDKNHGEQISLPNWL